VLIGILGFLLAFELLLFLLLFYLLFISPLLLESFPATAPPGYPRVILVFDY